MNLIDAIKLIMWGAFADDPSRGRLFQYAARVATKLEQGERRGFARHGYFDGGVLVPDVAAALELWRSDPVQAEARRWGL